MQRPVSIKSLLYKLLAPITLVNWGLRWNNVEDAILLGIIISLIVALLLAITGWYGAALVYRRKVAVIGPNDRHD